MEEMALADFAAEAGIVLEGDEGGGGSESPDSESEEDGKKML